MKMYYLFVDDIGDGPDEATVIADSKEEACRFVVEHLNTETEEHDPEMWREAIKLWEDPDNVTVSQIVEVTNGWCNCSYSHIC